MSAASIRRSAGAALFVLIASVPYTAAAQLIGIRTVPVASGDQFLIYPSVNVALGGVSIALDDPLLDPFLNPAKGARLQGMQLVGSPTLYTISNRNGSGRTLPIAFLAGAEQWFGGASFALQQLIAADRDQIFFGWWGGPPDQTLSERSATNLYAHGFLGRSLGNSGLSLGGSVASANLGAVDGVEHLYAMSRRIEQDGGSLDLRVGLLGEWESGRTVEALFVHSRFDMKHDVTYLDLVAVEGMEGQPVWEQGWEWVARVEENLDQTNTSGLHVGYVQPLTESGWRVGATATGNRKSHPKIPNYEIQNIPRDPGDSWAYNFSMGIAKTGGPASYGIDIVFEPIWSDTWADAASDTLTASGGTIRAGERTVDNEFFFSNATIRMGVGRSLFDRGGFKLGLELRSIQYDLEQFNHVTESRRTQQESWMEWTPTWGLDFGFPEFELRYLGRLTTGTGRPGVAWSPESLASRGLQADFILAPEAPLTLQDARVMTHRISIAIPVR